MKKQIVALLASFFAFASFAQAAPALGPGGGKPVAGVAKKKPVKSVHKTVRKTTHKIVKSAGK